MNDFFYFRSPVKRESEKNIELDIEQNRIQIFAIINSSPVREREIKFFGYANMGNEKSFV